MYLTYTKNGGKPIYVIKYNNQKNEVFKSLSIFVIW